MKTDIVNINNEVVSQVDLHPEIYSQDFREDIIAKIIHWQLAKRRLGTHQVKERGDVSGSTRKIYKQKGSGRARHGGIRAAQFRGGGIIFGPHFRDHGYKLNKKVRKLGLKIALSHKNHSSSMYVLNDLDATSNKTSDINSKLKAFDGAKKLILCKEISDNLRNSCSNLSNVNLLSVSGLNVYDIIRHDVLIILSDSLSTIEERLL